MLLYTSLFALLLPVFIRRNEFVNNPRALDLIRRQLCHLACVVIYYGYYTTQTNTHGLPKHSPE